jgi:predicted SAM-dependent methyltransferase
MKLELGAGLRPTRGYTHHDGWAFPHIEHVGDPWMLDLPDQSLDEVLAVAFIEHLTYDQACDTFRNVRRMLKPGGTFLFDVPDYPRWVTYYLQRLGRYHVPDDDTPGLDHIRRTLFGWGRWPGDSHLYGWDHDHLGETLETCGFRPEFNRLDLFVDRVHRERFTQPWDAHLYVAARP